MNFLLILPLLFTSVLGHGSGKYFVQNRNTNLCLTAPELKVGAELYFAECGGHQLQMFDFAFFNGHQFHLKTSFSAAGGPLYAGVHDYNQGGRIKLFSDDGHWWQYYTNGQETRFKWKNQDLNMERSHFSNEALCWTEGDGGDDDQHFHLVSHYNYNMDLALKLVKPDDRRNWYIQNPREKVHIKLNGKGDGCLTAARGDENNELYMSRCTLDPLQQFEYFDNGLVKSYKVNGKCIAAKTDTGKVFLRQCERSWHSQGLFYDSASKLMRFAYSNVHCLNMWDGVGPLKSVVCSPHENNVKFEVTEVNNDDLLKGFGITNAFHSFKYMHIKMGDKCMDVDHSSIKLEKCVAKENQKFALVDNQLKTGKELCLQLSEGSLPASGSKLHFGPCKDREPHNQWIYPEEGGKKGKLVNFQDPKLCVAREGSDIKLQDCDHVSPLDLRIYPHYNHRKALREAGISKEDLVNSGIKFDL